MLSGRVLCLVIALVSAGAVQATTVDDAFRCYPVRPVDHGSPTIIQGWTS